MIQHLGIVADEPGQVANVSRTVDRVCIKIAILLLRFSNQFQVVNVLINPHILIHYTYSDADVTANVTQHSLQSHFEDVHIESHQFIVVQVNDLKVIACGNLKRDLLIHLIAKMYVKKLRIALDSPWNVPGWSIVIWL